MVSSHGKVTRTHERRWDVCSSLHGGHVGRRRVAAQIIDLGLNAVAPPQSCAALLHSHDKSCHVPSHGSHCMLRFTAAAQQTETEVDKICHSSFPGLHLTLVTETQKYSDTWAWT